MSTGSFEKNSLGWQLAYMQQQLGEWWELQTSRFAPNIPNMSLPSWLSSSLLWTIVKITFWLLLAFVLSWIVVWMMRRLSPYFYSLRNQWREESEPGKIISRELTIRDWLKQSQKFQQQGNYREACLCLYKAMLQQLNDSGIATHQSSRTDGEYLQLIQQLPKSSPYQILLMTHQQLCFSNIEASLSLLEECQQAYREIASL